MPELRIQKAIADAGVVSRRAAEQLVAAGRVMVNGQPASVGQRVDPERDAIVVHGRPLPVRSAAVYLALAKPAGVTSTVSDRHAERTVVELVSPELRRRAGRLYPVGRLDRDSEGLLLLTNDGDWAQRVLHPRHEVEREYAVGLSRPLEDWQGEGLLDGIEMEEGVAQLLMLRHATGPETRKVHAAMGGDRYPLHWYRAVLAQGWRRQLRRMFAAVEAPVERLVRVRVGTLRLDGLHAGEAREIPSRERDAMLRDARSAGPIPTRQPVVSLDGPGSSGKSSVGAGAAAQLGFGFCDTGLLYRALTWLALERNADPDDASTLVALVSEITLAPDERRRYSRVQVAGNDVTEQVHTRQVDRFVSQVARHPEVRGALLPVQRRIAEGGGMIMAGRDIGTVVLPDADVKLWLEVSLEERARRRAVERGVPLDDAAAAAIAEDLRRRDHTDSTRTAAPLRVPPGATVIETEGNTLEQTIAAVVRAIRVGAARQHGTS